VLAALQGVQVVAAEVLVDLREVAVGVG